MPQKPNSARRPNSPRRAKRTSAPQRGPVPVTDLSVAYEDDQVIVVDKPVGMLSSVDPEEPSPTRAPNAFDLVKSRVREAAMKRGTRAWIIHRLDRDVSGLLVFAKTEAAYEWLKEDLRARRLGRTYIALVEGDLDSVKPEGRGAAAKSARASAAATPLDVLWSGGATPSLTIRSILVDSGAGRVRSAPKALGREPGSTDDAEGRRAVTLVSKLGGGSGRTLLQVKLETGRKHQIRAHLSELGLPIVGDRRYGATSDPLGRIALHAAGLTFPHPTSGAMITLSSPVPEGFYTLCGATPPRREMREAVPVVGRAAAKKSTASEAARSKDSVGRKQGEGKDQNDSWDHVAGWYDELIGEHGSDHYREVILPGALRLIAPRAGQRVLDVACGQGVLARKLAAMDVDVLGVDSSQRLVTLARKQSEDDANQRFIVGDARELDDAIERAAAQSNVPKARYDVVTSIMALMNIEPLEPLFASVARALRPGGAFVAVILHPAFRAPGQTSWGWDAIAPSSERDGPRRSAPPRGDSRDRDGRGRDSRGRESAGGRGFRDSGPSRGTRGAREDAPAMRQFRRVDGYLSTGEKQIIMNPGAVSSGDAVVATTTYHRPLQTYVRLLASQGFLIEAMEEWPSMRRSQPGPRADEENRARREIPLFLGLRAVLREGRGGG